MKKFTPNTFQCPNALVDQYAEILSGNAFKCLTIIIRKTRGWHKDSDAISHSSFKGMSTNTAKTALKELVERGLINATAHPNRPATYSLTDFFDTGLSEIDTQCLSIIDTQDNSSLSKIDMQNDACLSKIDTQEDACLSIIDGGVSEIDTPRISKIDTTKDILLKNTIQKESKRTRKVKTSIPAGFKISESVAAWASEKGFTHLQQHLESFIDKCQAKGYEYSDWDAAFRDAIRKNWAGIGQSNQPQYSQPRQDTAQSTRQVESPAPESSQRVSLFSGMELIKFNELRAVKPEITQIQVRELAKQHSMDVFVLMDRMVKKLNAGEAA